MKTIKLIVLLLCVAISGFAQNFPEKENKLVYDQAGMLSSDEVAQLETKLRYYNDSTSTQIAVVIIPTLDGYEIADYANRLASKWGIGQKGQNNGLLMLAAVKEHKFRIEVGYGLEGTITDAISKRIIENSVKPNFKAGNYYAGINEATDNVVLALRGEYKAKKKGKGDAASGFAVIGIILFVLFFVIFSQSRKAKALSAKNNIPFWAAWALLNAMSNRGRYNNFSGGGGGFGGGGGGGIDFGGFGGGGFGGGGASGDW